MRSGQRKTTRKKVTKPAAVTPPVAKKVTIKPTRKPVYNPRPKKPVTQPLARKTVSTAVSSHSPWPSEPPIKTEAKRTKVRMVFASEAGYYMAGIVEGKQFTDFWIQEERAVDYGKAGNVYRGIVSKVLPSLNAAFVNIGLDKDGFLSYSDLAPEFQLPEPQNKRKKYFTIDDYLHPGDPVLVQMAKEAIADKGPSLTRKISIPGRFLVYMPGADAVRMSRMLSEEDKKRFRSSVKNQFDFEGGLIFRTASQGQDTEDIENDLNYLNRIWRRIQNEYPSGTEPKLIHKELDLFERVLRDNFSDDVEEIIIDHPRLKYRLAQFLKVIAPDTDIDRLVTFHTDRSKSVWQAFDLSKDLDRLFSKTIHLDCGGYIIIEEMETLTAIDINTGKNIAGKSLEETIFETNMEAAIEIPRQLRLRQIGGIIVCDFIDMRIRRNQDKVFKTLQEELSKDRTPSDIQEFTDLGLIQITRQRSGRSLTSQLTYECPHCHGRGRRPTFSFE
ncbi:MAG: Rne/Rng family ribonuclease [bacterium]|jgi:ribonuclease G|nr:Rne/Rng family ribonuclease [bacterium]